MNDRHISFHHNLFISVFTAACSTYQIIMGICRYIWISSSVCIVQIEWRKTVRLIRKIVGNCRSLPAWSRVIPVQYERMLQLQVCMHQLNPPPLVITPEVRASQATSPTSVNHIPVCDTGSVCRDSCVPPIC